MSDSPAPSIRLSDGAVVAPTPRPEPAPDPNTALRLANIRSELAEARRVAEAFRADVASLPDILDDNRGDGAHIARLNLRRTWANAEARYEGLVLSERRETAEAAR
jgi:hypothetical protein